MPTYEYVCRKCGKKFALVLRMQDHAKKRVSCVKCSSKDVAQRITPFFANTSKKS